MASEHYCIVRIDLQGFVADMGTTFEGLTISQVEGGWRVVLRAREHGGTAVYAIGEIDDLWDDVGELFNHFARVGGAAVWRYDKYRNE